MSWVVYGDHDIRAVIKEASGKDGTPLVDWHHYLKDVDENKV